MDELPAPDLRDHRGRLHRILIALAVGFGCAAIAWRLAYGAAGHDFERGEPGAGKFIFFVAGLALFLGYQLTLKLLEYRAKRIYEASQIPRARIR